MFLEDIQRALLESIAEEGGRRKNINPKIWGRDGWAFLDKVADSYPVKPDKHDRLQMIRFLTSLGYALPCQKCRHNYIDFVMEYPPVDYVGSKRRVKQWIKLYKSVKK